MIPDYVVVAWLLDIVSAMLTYWPICVICTMALWALFTIRIGNQRELCMQDLMPGDANE
jgi:hypothetical protein